jgi:hypothetical protein
MAAENVGIAIIIWKDWTNIPQANDIFIRGRSGCLHLRIVTTKFTDPSIDEIPRIFTSLLRSIMIIAISPPADAKRVTLTGRCEANKELPIVETDQKCNRNIIILRLRNWIISE